MKGLKTHFIVLLICTFGVCYVNGIQANCSATLFQQCAVGTTECLARPLSPTAPVDEPNYVCNCTNIEDIGYDCRTRDPGHRAGGFITCYGDLCRSGTFESQGYPNLYPNQWEATYLLYVPGASRIDFEFVGEGGFGIEGFKDELYVGTGLLFSDDLIRTVNVSMAVVDGIDVRFFDNVTSLEPGRTFPSPFSLETDTAWLYFRTDKNLRFNGWRLQWNAIVDTTPPFIISCPMDIPAMIESGEPDEIEITWSEPFANDIMSPPVTFTQTHFPGQLFPIGDTNVIYRFSDRFGNEAICSFVVSVTGIDTMAPMVFGCPDDISRTIELGSPDPQVAWVEPFATDASGTVELLFRSLGPGSTFAPGVTPVTYIFSDLTDNRGTCSFNIEIITEDTIPPTISGCPADISETIELGLPGRVISWTEPTASDISGTEMLSSRSDAPGTFFSVDVLHRTITYIFVDASGNTAICEFMIWFIIVDTTPPTVIDCPTAITNSVQVDLPGTTIQWDPPTFFDASDNVVVVPSHNPNQFFISGLTTVTYLFTDTTGNSALCSFCVNVIRVDSVPPVISDCPSQQTITVELGITSAQVVWLQPSATDNSGTATLQTQTHSPGDSFSLGPTTVRYIFVDPASNPAICEFIVLVQTVDTTPPSITGCPVQPVVEQVELGITGTFVTWTPPTATDLSNPVTINVNQNPGTFFLVGTMAITYTFTDAANNQNFCTFDVVVTTMDTTPPSITGCPVQPVVEQVELGMAGAFVTWTPPTATDLSNPVTINVNQNPGTFFLVGTMAITYTFTDAANNQNFCTFDVVVTTIDTMAPTIIGCPADSEAFTELGTPGRMVSWIEPTAFDVSGTERLQSRSNDPNSFFTIGSTDVTYSFIDDSGNVAICQFTVTVTAVDNMGPIISGCPADFEVIIELGQTSTTVTWTEPTATDVSGFAVLSDRSNAPNDEFFLGNNEVRYVFVDNSNNMAVCSFVITISTIDTTPPDVMGCPQSVLETVELGVTSVPVFWVEPTVTDISGTERLDDRSHQPGQPFIVGSTTVTYVFSDASNNIARCIFNVIVTTVDTTPPSITGCPVQPVVEQVELGITGTFVTWTPPTATDMSNPVTVNVNQNPGTFFLVGTMAITYTFTDAANNQNFCTFDVVVITTDTTDPEISGCPVLVMEIVELGEAGRIVTWVEPTATDLSGAVDVSRTRAPDEFFIVGDTTVIYTFTDSSMNTAECVFTVRVTTDDTTPPEILNCPSDIQEMIELGAADPTIFWVEPRAMDLSETRIVSQSSSPGQTFPVGSTVVTYIFADTSDNNAICSFMVTVITMDTTPPTISNCPATQSISVELGLTEGNVIWVEPSATDLSGTADLSVRSHAPGSEFPLGQTTVMYIFVDASMNANICQFIVIVNTMDTMSPIISDCPGIITQEIELGLTGTTIFWTEPTATDLSGVAIVTMRSNAPNDFFTTGLTTVSYTFSDNAGNTAVCTFMIFITTIDTIPPTISGCPADISETIELGLPGRVISWIEPTASDTSGTAMLSSRSDAPGTFFAVDVLHRTITYTFVDASGNTANCEFMLWFIIEDTVPPTISGCPNDMSAVIELGTQTAVVGWTEPTATDISGTVVLTSRSNGPGESFSIGMTTVVYLFSDETGNVASCSFLVTVTTEDTTPPMIVNCPSLIERQVELGVPGLIITWIEPSATDISGSAMLVDRTHAPNDFFPAEITQVIYTFRDSSLNEAVCAFMISITTVDTTPPECVNLPAFVSESTELGNPGRSVTWIEPTCQDISNVASVTARSNLPGSFFLVGDTVVTYTCTDGSGNSATCSFPVQVITIDTVRPLVLECPGVDAPSVSATIELGITSAIVQFDEPTAMDASNSITVVPSCNSGVRYPVGTTPCTFTFTDSSGNSDQCVFTITVLTEDTTPPQVFQCPPEVREIVELGVTSTVVRYDEPFATDNSNAPNLLQTQTCQPGGSYPVGETSCLYLFVDPDGNSNSCTFLIIVTTMDRTPPTISNCPTAGASTVVELGLLDGVVFWSEPTATDLAGATLLPRTGRPGDSFPLGATPIVYVFTDPSGNEATCTFIVTVTTEDTIPPTISGCPADISETIELGLPGRVISWTEPTASDISGTEMLSSRSDAPGTFFAVDVLHRTITYIFVDASGNTAICEFMLWFIIEDTTPPVIMCSSDVTVTVEVTVPSQGGAAASFSAATATDLSGTATTLCDAVSGNFFVIGNTVVTCTAADQSGNEAMCTFNVNVIEVDTTDPVVTCQEDVSVIVIEGASGAFVDFAGAALISDNSGSASIISISPQSGSFFEVGSRSVVVIVADAAGNDANCVFQVIVSEGNPCDPDPCQNGGFCVIDSINQFQCVCPDCFSGTVCEIEANACDVSTCQNGAACVEVEGSCTLFTCECSPCFFGEFCQNFQDACQNNDCQNGGNCMPDTSCTSYTCTCPSCFEGPFCEQTVNPCELATCLNGAQCLPDTQEDCSGYACICTGCFVGVRCDLEIDPCFPNPCQNGALCFRDAINCFQYTCQCQGCFNGADCEVAIPDPCSFNPCQNGALCTRLTVTCNAYRCTCPPGFGGFNCDMRLSINANPCNSFPCDNGATCVQTSADGYVCFCTDGYAGINCGQFAASLPILQFACASNPCVNDGFCRDSFNSLSNNQIYQPQYSCICPEGFTGTNCQLPTVVSPQMNMCLQPRCQNGGVCVNTYDSFSLELIYSCQCQIGFVGQDCEIPAPIPCLSNPCQNGGQCRDFNTYFLCLCIDNFSGRFCQVAPNTGRPVVINCPSEDIIVETDGGSSTVTWEEPIGFGAGGSAQLIYRSHAPGDVFFAGETPVTYLFADPNFQFAECMFFVIVRSSNRCLGLPCMNGGSCLQTGNQLCDCSGTGFGGPRCDSPLCSPNPCMNGGFCQVVADSFTCFCLSPYSGTFCEMRDDGCSPNPCQNGGTCTPLVNNDFRCTCQAGFGGDSCELGVDPIVEVLLSELPNGIFQLDGFPEPYADNLDMRYIVRSNNPNVVLQMTILVLDLRTGDILQIGSGSVIGNNVLGTFNGNTVPPAQALTSTSNSAWCRFTSNSDGLSGTGFIFRIVEVPGNACLPNPCQNGGTCSVVNGSPFCICPPGLPQPTCSVVLSDLPGGILGLQSFPGLYQDGLSLFWILQDDNPDAFYELVLVDLDLGAGDVLEFGSGSDIGVNVLETFNGLTINNVPLGNRVFSTSSNAAWITFNSNFDGLRGTGFQLQIIRRVLLVVDGGQFALDSYPDPYPDNSNIGWIFLDMNTDVRYDIVVVDLDLGDGDLLSFGSGTVIGENVLFSFNAMSIEDLVSVVNVFTTESNGGWITFQSDDDGVTGRGFLLTLVQRTVINGDITPPVITGCDQNFEFFSFPPTIDSFAFFWEEPTATDNDGEPPVVSRSLVPGTAIGFGVPQYVHYNFTDTSGNIAFCWFRILFDSEPPFLCRPENNQCAPDEICDRDPDTNLAACIPLVGRKRRDVSFNQFIPNGDIDCQCQNGGSCASMNTGQEFCLCTENFEGATCEVPRTKTDGSEYTTYVSLTSLTVVSLLVVITIFLAALTCMVFKQLSWRPTPISHQKLIS
ncbi:uncharacterized protein [Apostichopus japonicus]|uniref:uncharacterized protein isoform X3 n=1 Tax=Stichopus japonicus TaxID=307972 RepID=UPI003AB7EB68